MQTLDSFRSVWVQETASSSCFFTFYEKFHVSSTATGVLLSNNMLYIFYIFYDPKEFCKVWENDSCDIISGC